MLTSREYRRRIAFRKTIEDLLYDGPENMRHLFAEINTKTNKPEFLTDISPSTLDLMYENYAPEKWLSKIGAVPYSVVNDELVHSGSLSDLADAIIAAYGPNWDRIWDAYTDEYSPLNNYDMYQKETFHSAQEHDGADTLSFTGTETVGRSGTETTNRTGTETTERTGTETNAKTGTETTARTGTETTERTGTETNAKSGTETTSRTGTDTTEYSGQKTRTQGGSEVNVKSGSEQLAKTGSEKTGYNSVNENLVSAFNLDGYAPANKGEHSGADGVTYGVNANDTSDPRLDTTTYNNVTDTKTYNAVTDTESFANREDETTHNTQDQLSLNSQNQLTLNTENETTLNTQDQLTLNSQNQLTLNTEDETTLNTQDQLTLNTQQQTSFNGRSNETEYDSQLRHTGYDELERRGNIGVTTSQQMLQSEIDLRQYNFIMSVFRDITDLISLPIY